jgi:hypothetical protein
MSQLKAVSETRFRELLAAGLGQYIDRAVVVLNNYGARLSFDVANVMLYAAEKGKVEEVLGIMEKHWEEHLNFQHPDIRGLVVDMGVNLTQQMFLKICKETLGLTPNKE